MDVHVEKDSQVIALITYVIGSSKMEKLPNIQQDALITVMKEDQFEQMM